MKVIEQYNETQTKAYLEGLYPTEGSLVSVSYYDIYDALGMEKENNDTYAIDNCEAQFLDLVSSFLIVAQGDWDPEKQLSKKYTEELQKYRNAGDYFHIQSNRNIMSNERMIINVTTQEAALKIVEYVRNHASDMISSIKFWGMKLPKILRFQCQAYTVLVKWYI